MTDKTSEVKIDVDFVRDELEKKNGSQDTANPNQYKCPFIQTMKSKKCLIAYGHCWQKVKMEHSFNPLDLPFANEFQQWNPFLQQQNLPQAQFPQLNFPQRERDRRRCDRSNVRIT